MTEFEKCSLCCEYQPLLEGDCCSQHLCKVCLNKWLEKQDTCPFCRNITQEEKWSDLKKNVGYKVSVICETLKQHGVSVVSVEKDEFERLQPYFEDYVLLHKGTKMNNPCLCSTDYSKWYGANKCVVVDFNLRAYYEYYVCSRCAHCKPLDIWNRLLRSKKFSSYEPINVSPLRDKLIDFMKGKHTSTYKDNDWKAIEEIVFRYYLKYKTYVDLEDYKFIVNLLVICSGDVDINRAQIFNFMLKYLDRPTQDWQPTFFMKFFFCKAWKGSMKGEGFLGLYPIISLWNITRDPEQRFTKRSESYDLAVAYKKEWLEEMGISSPF